MEEENINNPEMKFVVDESGNVSVEVGWKKPNNRDEFISTANRLCGLIFHLSSGRMLSTLQKAIAVAAQLRGESDMSKLVNETLDDMINSNQFPGIKKSKGEPLVPPRRVFNVRNEE